MKSAGTKPAAGWKAPTRARVLRIRDRLREVYGIPRMAPHGRPLDELVLTVLSQSTNDRNRDVAFLRLRERFARAGGAGGSPSPVDYEAVLAAPVSEVEEAIRPGGISKVKSARIQAILRAIAEAGEAGQPAQAAAEGRMKDEGASVAKGWGGSGGRKDEGTTGAANARRASEAGSGTSRVPGHPLSLDWMRAAPVEDSRAFLCSLPGVGRKTAACVLLFSYGLPDVPVDTHVSRVGTRLGLFRPGAPFEELHDAMLALTPPGQELELHVNLLRHGRRTCHARKPACLDCALARMCPSRRLFVG